MCLRLTRNGEPAANMFVELQNADQKNFDVYGGLSLDSYTGFTDASGVLYLTQVPVGTYWGECRNHRKTEPGGLHRSHRGKLRL